MNAIRYFQLVGAVTESCAPYGLSRYLYGVHEDEEPAHKRANPIQCPASCSDGTALRPGNLRLGGYQPLQESEVLSALNTGPVIADMDVPSKFFTY